MIKIFYKNDKKYFINKKIIIILKMNRPQFKTPDGRIIQIFSEDVEDLLDQGYTIEELFGIKRNQLPILETSQGIPFTGYPDIDLHILDNMYIYQIKKICSTNKYTRTLCNRSDYWKQRIMNEQLYVPNPLDIKNVNWMEVYEAAFYTEQDMKDLKNDGTFGLSDISDINIGISNIHSILKKFIKLPEKITSVTELVFYYNTDTEKYSIGISYPYRVKHAKVTQDQIQNILFYYHYINNY